MNLRGLLVYLSIVLGIQVVLPQRVLAVDDEATLQARKHYQEAQKQFDLGRWDTAIAEFSKAYELRPDPIFLFNMAQAYRRAGNARRAIDLYKNYLIKVPKSPQRAEVEERIKTLQRQLDEEERDAKRAASVQQVAPIAPVPFAAPVPATAPDTSNLPAPEIPSPTESRPMPADVQPPTAIAAPESAGQRATGVTEAGVVSEAPAPTATADGELPPPAASATVGAAPALAAPEAAPVPQVAAVPLPAADTGSHSLRMAGIVTGAVGLAGIGAGIFFSVRTKSLSNSVSNAVRYNPSDVRSGKRDATLQWVCYLSGGAALVTGGLLYWTGRARNGEQTTVGLVPSLTPTSAGLLASGSF